MLTIDGIPDREKTSLLCKCGNVLGGQSSRFEISQVFNRQLPNYPSVIPPGIIMIIPGVFCITWKLIQSNKV